MFATKHREPTIADDLSSPLYNFLTGVCRNLNCYADCIGGYHDHIHIAERVSNYIEGQWDHHRRVSFQDELRKLLKENAMMYDER